MSKYPSTHACAVRERTADGVNVGRCWFHVEAGQCPRHGDVTKVQAEYASTGCLTDEGDLYEARGQRPPWCERAIGGDMTTAWLIERKDARLCYAQDGSSCLGWVTFTDPAAWRFDDRTSAEAIITERGLHALAVEHQWVRASSSGA